MDHVEEKLAALKKAYVDVILNTAKESAVRVLAAESKAVRLQQNLKDAKDEALNTLLRVKGVMDAKTKEANTISLGQTRKIHDLEGQLHKAKQTIACLMVELKRVSNEMEKMKSSIKEETQINDLDSEMKDQVTCFEDTLGETKSISNSVQCCAIHRHNDKPTADGLKKSISSTSQVSSEHCHFTSNISFQINSLQESPQRNNFSSSPDLPSLIMSSKEPELYRNGCTQRIRALEQNDMSGKVLQGKDERQSKNVCVGCKDEKQLVVSLVDSCMGTNIGAQSTEPNIILTENVVCEGEVPYSSSYSSGKLKRRARNTDKVTAGNECSRISRNDDETPQNSRNALSTQSMEKCNMVLLRCGNTSLGHLLVKDELPTPDTETGFCGETLSEIDRNHGLPDKSIMENRIPTANGVQSGEGPTMTDNSDGLHYKVKMETTDAPIDNDETNDNSSGLKSALTKATGERHLKYTFQRKRIRGTSASTSEDILPEKQGTLKMKTSDILSPSSSSPPPPPPPSCEKSSMAKELPRENRRIAQVARQLISLSEKRW